MTNNKRTKSPAIARIADIDVQLSAARSLRAMYEETIEKLEEARVEAVRALAAEEAAAASDSLPVGTRVRHRTFADLLATVVPSDGTGVSVVQDNVTEVSNGYGPGEWVPIEV